MGVFVPESQAMDNHQRRRAKSFRRWFSNKHKSTPHSSLFSHLSDESGDEYDEDEDEEEVSSFMPSEMDPCILINELRIFVATWNVAGRSPVKSLALDLDEWLNVKESADIYVLGFQEIVPLKPKNVIGGEDLTQVTKWNLLIGQILNEKSVCPWITPMPNSITSEDYNYLNVSERERSAGASSATRSPEEELNHCNKYRLMASKKMVGVFISVWMSTALFKRYCISRVKVCAVACGMMGYLGNKGSVSVSMSIEGTSFCFIVAHLASGEKKGDEGRRNHQVSEIFKRTAFTRHLQDDCTHRPLTILGHDQIFWFGDLNYRLYLENDLARELIRRQDWSTLQEFDQLRQELGDGGVFQGWREGNIEFAPTYKYSAFNGNRYSGTLPSRAGEKQRTPAWCDRILWYGKGVKQHSYFRSESKFSDHRPVSALFSIQIEGIKCDDADASGVLDIPTTVSCKHTEQQKVNGGLRDDVINEERGDGKASATLLSLITKELEASPSNEKSHRKNW